MARLTQAQSSALADWWNLAYDAAIARLGSSTLLEAASSLAREAGRSLTFTESTAIVQLYSYAARIAGASREIQSALDTATLGPEHIATPPWARDEPEMNTAPIWHVVYEFSYIDADGNAQTDFRTSVFDMTLPGTAGDLRDAIDEDGQALALKYRLTFTGTNITQILAV